MFDYEGYGSCGGINGDHCFVYPLHVDGLSKEAVKRGDSSRDIRTHQEVNRGDWVVVIDEEIFVMPDKLFRASYTPFANHDTTIVKAVKESTDLIT